MDTEDLLTKEEEKKALEEAEKKRQEELIWTELVSGVLLIGFLILIGIVLLFLCTQQLLSFFPAIVSMAVFLWLSVIINSVGLLEI